VIDLLRLDGPVLDWVGVRAGKHVTTDELIVNVSVAGQVVNLTEKTAKHLRNGLNASLSRIEKAKKEVRDRD